MNQKKVPVLSIIFYVLAGLLAIYMGWSIVNVAEYLSQYQFSGQEYAFVSSYMTSALQYGIYAIILFGIGWILQKLPTPPAQTVDQPDFVPEQMETFETVSVDTPYDENQAYAVADEAEDQSEQEVQF